MRFQTEFNYILKIREGQGLPDNPEVGKTYQFSKTIERIYPLHLPIFLVDDDLQAVGKCVINEYTAGSDTTAGTYTIISLYDEGTAAIMSKDIQESFDYVKRS